MPNRIIKESICTSEKISSLTDFEFRLWAGLITQVDDAGRGDARPAIIKGRIFPLRDRVTIKDVDAALHGLAAKGCVSLYTVGGKPYFWFPTWTEHQRIRDCKPKYPSPEDADTFSQPAADCGNPPQIAATCGNLRQPAADCGYNPIQSESNPNTNPNPNQNPNNAREALDPFDAFWESYPRKTGKEAARKAFKKLDREVYALLVPAVERQKRSRQWQEDNGRFIPNPATWLNQGRWEDEVEPEKENTQKGQVGAVSTSDIDFLFEMARKGEI